ncbi:hypothetical protein CMMCAS05_14695 [Clavibacter michiganensis subsp. michiganensis]|nr:hypothetical protein CMMCAS05_14695 [Clavibacter michiganensis subsp. michiganensis]
MEVSSVSGTVTTFVAADTITAVSSRIPSTRQNEPIVSDHDRRAAASGRSRSITMALGTRARRVETQAATTTRPITPRTPTRIPAAMPAPPASTSSATMPASTAKTSVHAAVRDRLHSTRGTIRGRASRHSARIRSRSPSVPRATSLATTPWRNADATIDSTIVTMAAIATAATPPAMSGPWSASRAERTRVTTNAVTPPTITRVTTLTRRSSRGGGRRRPPPR